MSSSQKTANRQIARAAGLVMAAFVFSQITGLTYQVLVAEAFGTDQSMDAFNAANRVSETLFRLIAGGALGSAFIPTFTQLLVKDDQERAWKLASAVGNLVLIILSALGILAACMIQAATWGGRRSLILTSFQTPAGMEYNPQ